MRTIELLPYRHVEGCLIEVIAGCLIMQTWQYKRRTFHTSARIDPKFSKLEGHHIVVKVNVTNTELELIEDYGRCKK